MQMESWRERGFVPDSDEEDDFDSQELIDLGENGHGNQSGEDGVVTGTTEVESDRLEEDLGSSKETPGDNEKAIADETSQVKYNDEDRGEKTGHQVAEPVAESGKAVDDRTGEEGLSSHEETTGDNEHSAASQNALEGEGVNEGGKDGTQAEVRPSAEEPVSASEPPKETANDKPSLASQASREDDNVVDKGGKNDNQTADPSAEEPVSVSKPPKGQSRERDGTTTAVKNALNEDVTLRPQDLPVSTNACHPSTPQPKQHDIWDVPSSPDELQLDNWRAEKQPAHGPNANDHGRPRSLSNASNQSYLSSTQASLHSLRLVDDHRQEEQWQTVQSQSGDSENILPPLGIPEHILQEVQELSLPRRSMRERNFNQMHPFLVEHGRWRKLMKQSGMKPFYLPQDRDTLRAAANESQDQDFVDQPSQSSTSDQDPQFQPSSPTHPRPMHRKRSQRESPRHENQRHLQRFEGSSTGNRCRTYKRQKTTHHSAQHDKYQIGNQGLPQSRGQSGFDILPSPPRSESVSSAHTPNISGGLLVPGGMSSPPLTTPVTESKRQSASTHYASAMGLSGSVNDPRAIDSSVSSQDEADVDEEDFDEEIKQHRRRIKGVLPASWIRLDKKEQERRTREHQRSRELTHRPENAKGVAKRVKRSNPIARSGTRPQWTSLMELADNEDEEEGNNEKNDDPDNADQALADFVGFEDPFNNHDFDDDIPEDNHIDYMFPPVPRGPRLGQNKNQGVKRKPERVDKHTGGIQKRARLKRQTRLTDPIYGTRKEKQPSSTSRQYAVLEAPDIAQRPRKEQPPFLRVAARQARLRRDIGRRPKTLNTAKLAPALGAGNPSFRYARSGAPQQVRLTQPPFSAVTRQPLAELSANEQLVSDNDNNGGTSDGPTVPGSIDLSGENGGNSSPTSNPSIQASRDRTTSKLPLASQGLGNKWITRRSNVISSMRRNAPRPAISEIEEIGRNVDPPSFFQRTLSRIDRDYRQNRAAQRQKPSRYLDQFLTDSASSITPLSNRQSVPVRESSESNRGPDRLRAPRRQLKKRPPRQLTLDNTDRQKSPITFFRGADSPTEEVEYLEAISQRPNNLGFQNSYSTDFGIVPVCPGTFFHESTFLGSGEFSHLSRIRTRDLDKDAGLFSISIEGRNCRWGSWNETVSSELGFAFETLIEGAEKMANLSEEADRGSIITQGCVIYRSLVRYVTETLSFTDPVDRTGFVIRAHDLVSKLNDPLAASTSSNTAHNREYVFRLCCYNLVFATQISQIASHDIVDHSIAKDMLNLTNSVARQLFSFVLSHAGLSDIREFLKDNKVRECRDAGVRDNHPSVEAFVIAQQLLRSDDSYKGWLENIITEAILPFGIGEPNNQNNIQALEAGWHRLFTTLPLNEIDQFGIAHVGSRFRAAFDNWKLVQRLLGSVPFKGDLNSSAYPILDVKYCRVLLHRCFQLINDWGWRDCKPILDTLFDIFAWRMLYNLPREEAFGSPDFLENLDRNPSLALASRDSCFHILLKIIGSGLRFMSKTYDKKKIRNFAWRLLPNNGRVYPKEEPLRREDLDALRNHHDLICTLYWAVPDGCRPSLKVIENLVDPARSHLETCKISLRSWVRLVRFKLSTHEDVSGLDSFGDWHSRFVTELLKQHSHARTEIETQSNGDSRFSHQVIETIIARNQQQIEELLKSALGGLESAVQLSLSLEHARRLVLKLPIGGILDLANPKFPRVNSILSDALRIVIAYTKKSDTAANQTAAISSDEDSQDYGDWKLIFGIEDFGPKSNPGIEHIRDIFYPAVSRFASNCFGADHPPEDSLLLSVVDCWTSIAEALVKNGERRWDSYLNPYEGDSWTALRSTVQTRKFTPQFLASCIEKDSPFFSECKTQVLKIWMSTLVERTSMLKFQHRLTEALLNQDPENPLLKNLPFSKNRNDDRYSITLEDFRQRRLSLISSLLSNMREHLQEVHDVDGKEHKEMKQEYSEAIQGLMSSMKSNYQELTNGVQSAQGAYVDFVHCIVGFLQQHTRDISAIDSFFTDPKSFPLPSADPRYIVARLKSYEPKLSTEKAVKALIVFIQGVSERAATDSEQVYLVDQLRESMANTYEGGSVDKPTLRAALLQCAFPAYLEMAFKHPAAWILSRPILQTITPIFKELLFDMDTTDSSCVSSVMNIFTSVFQASYQAFQHLTDDPDLLKEPTVLITATKFLEMITSSLPIVEYIDRVTEVGEQLVSQVQAFHQFALFAFSRLRDEALPYSLEEFIRLSGAFSIKDVPPSKPSFFEELRYSATRELNSYIRENYSRHHGKYYFTRRGSPQPKEIEIDHSVAALLEGAPGVVFENAVQNFLNRSQSLDLFW
ncbi:hypothetical protein PHISCL_05960 [Aspergillus sclerotialis]|uniref:Uncharacterized protein n=1 Tax=Aspergillus sclerotialis TaxID=2070753 RepID=A0A3A2ZXC3_9EURO|nr:hypothetical protein PHISCL_05960 [Aspergillus sclerotialis]